MHNHQHVGHRYQVWLSEVEPKLTASQKATGYETFAAEFASLPAWLGPSEGWGQTMAYLCRRIARRHRGQPLDEWVNRDGEPASDRVAAPPASRLG